MLELTGRISRANELAGSTSGINRMQGQIQGIRGEKGDKGDRGEKGDKGDTGVGVASTLLNADYTLTITLTDGTSYTTTSIRGEQGQQGVQGVKGDTGDTGNGISSVAKTGTQGLVDTYTITFTNGTTTTFTVTNGQNGSGSVADVWVNNVSVLDGYTAKVTVPTKTSDLTNDSGFITTETDPTVPNWAKQANKPSYSYSDISGTPTLATVATTGDYDDLTNKPTIPTVPTNVSAFTNDADYQTSLQVQAALTAYKNVYRIDLPSFSSLPLTFSNSKITADHEIINSVLGTPSAQTSEWTLTPTLGSATLSGSISGSTTLTLYIAEVESLTVT